MWVEVFSIQFFRTKSSKNMWVYVSVTVQPFDGHMKQKENDHITTCCVNVRKKNSEYSLVENRHKIRYYESNIIDEL